MDKRTRTDEAAKRRKDDGGGGDGLPIYATQFTKEEIESEVKKPKRKVAVLLGYSGSGYKGMQLWVLAGLSPLDFTGNLTVYRNHREKTIEGDLFAAMVAAGAISKANADDPKKSSLIRCARTDKGVHAAGNIISLKLIMEDEGIIQKINTHLSPQIRVFGIVRTNGSFNAYQFCDSRIYEYLIPTHCLLPPHPDSFLGKQIVALAEEAGDLEGFRERQSEVSAFWEETEETCIKPILEQLDPSVRSLVLQALYNSDKKSTKESSEAKEGSNADQEIPSMIEVDSDHKDTGIANNPSNVAIPNDKLDTEPKNPSVLPEAPGGLDPEESTKNLTSEPSEQSPLETAIKSYRTAYVTAKSAHRIPPTRLSRIRAALAHYIGTHNYHNYTVGKAFRDASAKRVIRSFTVAENPLIINGTEWLSLKVHGQSFMMHQIRKMVSMAAMAVRCGCSPEIIEETFTNQKISIPKAPGLGLLLERPVFDHYNERLETYGRDSIDFSIHATEMEEFKQSEIYERIFREEERDRTFHSFFAGIDNLRSAQMLYVSSLGVEATQRAVEGVGREKGTVEGVEGLESDEGVRDGEEG